MAHNGGRHDPVVPCTRRRGARRRAREAHELLGPALRRLPSRLQGRPARRRAGPVRVGRHAVVASYFPHFGEEDCLRGWSGSGTIFFSRLQPALRLLPEPRHLVAAARASASAPERLAEMMLELQAMRLPQHQLRHARARGAADPRGAAARGRAAACGCRSSTTRAPTTASTACGCWTASSTSTCPTSSAGRASARAAT